MIGKSAFPHDPSYAAEWQREADVAEQEHERGESLEDHNDNQAELEGDRQRDDEP